MQGVEEPLFFKTGVQPTMSFDLHRDVGGRDIPPITDLLRSILLALTGLAWRVARL